MAQKGKSGPTLVVSEMQSDLGVICEETKTERTTSIRHNDQYFSLLFVSDNINNSLMVPNEPKLLSLYLTSY